MPGPIVVKATLVFETNSFGWSESFLWDGVSEQNLNVHMQSLQIIAQKRAALLGSNSFIKAERVSLETGPDGLPRVGDSILQYIRYNGAGAISTDEPDVAVLVTMRNLVAAKRRNMFLRGIWDDVDATGGFYLPSISGWQSAFNAWAAAMLARQAGWWSYSKSAGFDVDTYAVAPTTGYVTLTVLGDAFGDGPYGKIRVRLAGVNVKSALNGQWIGTPVSNSQIVLEKPMALLPYTGGGTLFTYTRALEVAASLDAQKIVIRRAGAPLLQSRGRRRASVRT
jgi:hypothetical protein